MVSYCDSFKRFSSRIKLLSSATYQKTIPIQKPALCFAFSAHLLLTRYVTTLKIAKDCTNFSTIDSLPYFFRERTNASTLHVSSQDEALRRHQQTNKSFYGKRVHVCLHVFSPSLLAIIINLIALHYHLLNTCFLSKKSFVLVAQYKNLTL